MKKIVLVVTMICLTGIISGGFAQQRSSAQKPSEEERKARFEKFNAEREAFISKAMNLTDEEKQAFWPLCNELQMKKFELNRTLREEMRKINRARRENQPVSEADYKKALELGNRVKIQEAQLEQEYLVKFLQVIPAEKMFRYRQSEQNFGERMIRERSQMQQLSDNAKRHAEKVKEHAEKSKERMENMKEAQKERAKIYAERVKEHAEKSKERIEKATEAQKERMQAKKEEMRAKRDHYHYYRGI